MGGQQPGQVQRMQTQRAITIKDVKFGHESIIFDTGYNY